MITNYLSVFNDSQVCIHQWRQNQPCLYGIGIFYCEYNRRKSRKRSDRMKINLCVSRLSLHVKAFEVHCLPLSG